MLRSAAPAISAHLSPPEVDRRDQYRAHPRIGLLDPRVTGTGSRSPVRGRGRPTSGRPAGADLRLHPLRGPGRSGPPAWASSLGPPRLLSPWSPRSRASQGEAADCLGSTCIGVNTEQEP
jgi:hypothetical protein